MKHWVGAGAALALSTLSLAARAWQIEDPIHHNCHERISTAALERVGYVDTPPPLDQADSSLRDNVEFTASRYPANIYALSLVIGVRNADTHGGMDFSFNNNAAAANADDDQSAHCLRTKEQDGPAGDDAAVVDCRGTIESLYWQALSSLDDAGNVSADARSDVSVATQFQGPVSYPLSKFYYFAGRALHAVQDSFTHSFRSADGRRIRHVFNWSDQVSCSLDEARDGHGHETILDHCEDGDPSEPDRFALSIDASSELLGALTKPGTHAERAQRIADFLENWMSYEPGCSLDNRYCDSPSYAWLSHSDRSDDDICHGPLGCEAQGRRMPSNPTWLWPYGLLALLAVLRRRRLAPALALGLLTLLSAPRLSQAAEEDDEAPHARREAKVGGLRVEGRASLSVDNPAYAFGAAGMFAFARADVGVFAELNPWYSIERRRMSLGATNFGILGHYLHPLRRDLVLRFGLGVGCSMLNADMLGVKAGNLGLYLDFRAMGLIWQLTDSAALTVDPLDLALPAPALVGWPILFTQHRASIGLQFSL